ncbi:MAG: ribonuclease H family protein [Saprospiraceae bacterium]|nr:ribonuclease H family protein [Saprospiraceae bacterium]
MKKQKYYVVWQGVRPGIYNDWETAKKQISGFPGAQYKSYPTRQEAEVAFKSAPDFYSGPITKSVRNTGGSIATLIQQGLVIKNSICVDAACSGNPGDLEYRGVETATGKEIFRIGPLAMGTNNLGEFLAIVHAAALFELKGNSETVIYTDSRTAIAWIRQKNIKTTLQKSEVNKDLFALVERGLTWLKTHTIQNRIIHWDTPGWGEIPADFGRK